ncbi:MAG: ROK family protein [Ginsengibacter sp.]
MNDLHILGIDLGGTNIRGGQVIDNILREIHSKRINSRGTIDEVKDELFAFTDCIIDKSVNSIGIGVPGLIDTENKIVYDVVYIPSWKEVPLQQWMEDRYQVPVYINNDANCFALGEYYFGKGKGYHSLIGLTIGTGLGSGIVINNKLYEGKNGGAGEFGMVDYIDKTFEFYASGQFFNNVYNTDGEIVFENAKKGNVEALKMYEEMGMHLGNAIKMMLYSLDVELIVIGGSVRHAFPYFSEAMLKQLKTFGFQKAIRNLKIEISELENAGILGAAALCYDMSC